MSRTFSNARGGLVSSASVDPALFAQQNGSRYRTPIDLQVTPLTPLRFLAVGACLAEGFAPVASMINPAYRGDFVLVNNFDAFPAIPVEQAAQHDFQIVQIPLRSILGTAFAPQGVVEIHGDELDRVLLTDRAVHGEDLVQHGLEKLEPARGIVVLHRRRRLNSVEVVVVISVAEHCSVGEGPDGVVLAGLLPDAGGDLVDVDEVDVLALGDFGCPGTYSAARWNA
jgi:hypothetical protein